ncbi:LacI family DNA-binding transcriptional regulator [Alicyclobacillus kakegawensis]|uniref:LacI family DNA-binding transcriptional regulator n=1 Tax=Alicyclobacillus kakegawensis TaxID=392012 RepID=UPI00082A2D0C|nr:LacI family DNA-binding transcriptional regulator [Alicyclobacillus kakegawensis]
MGEKPVKPTIRDIAKKANVSVSTVSRVLNGSKPVSPDLREKVLSTIESLKYSPNPIARGLATGNLPFVVVMIPQFDEFFTELARGLELALPKGITVFLVDSTNDITVEKQIFELVSELKPVGLVLAAVAREWNYPTPDYPMVFVNRLPSGVLDRFDTVESDNYEGGKLAGSFIRESGHERVAIIAGPKGYRTSDNRVDGFIKGFRAGGNRDITVFRTDLSFESGLSVGQVLLGANTRYTAAFCVTDAMALGVMEAYWMAGKAVPRDISIIGFDDSWAGRLTPVQLTTVQQNPRQIGREAAGLLLRRLSNFEVEPASICLPVTLLKRKSVGRYLSWYDGANEGERL